MKEIFLPSFMDTVFNDNTIDLGSDIAELALDAITENDFIKEIPVVGSVVKLGRFAISVHDRHLLKQTLIFVQEVNNGSISSEKLNEHKKKIETDPKSMRRELEHIVILLDKQTESIKAKMLAKIYKKYIADENYTWNMFGRDSEIATDISIYDFDTYTELYNKQVYCEGDNFDWIALSRLSRFGLADFFNGMSVMTGKDSKAIMARISAFGIFFYDVCIQDSPN